MPEGTRHDAIPPSRLGLVAKNATANLIRAVSTSAVTVLLPLILVVVLAPGQYAVWALIFSLGAFVTYLDLGIPTTVQAMVGRALARENVAEARRVALSGLILVGVLGSICLLAAVVGGLFLTTLFPAVTAAQGEEARVALPIIVAGQASVLLSNVAAGFFAGHQRSHIPTIILTPARFLVLLGAVVGAHFSSLVATAVGYALPAIVATVVLILLVLRSPGEKPSQPYTLASFIEVIRYSGPLAIWGFCMLVTNGVGIALVARFDFGAVVIYSICAAFVALLAGAQSAVTAPWLPEFSRTYAQRGSAPLSSSVLSLSVLNSSFMFVSVAGMVSLSIWALPLLTGPEESGRARDLWIFVAIMVSNAIHLAGTPISLAFIATKTHSRIILPPVIEAVVSLVASVGLAIPLGALGVVLGSLIASCVGIVLCFSWSIRLSGEIRIPTRVLLTRCVVYPVVSVVPAVAVALGALVFSGSERHEVWVNVVTAVAAAIAIAVGAIVNMRFSLTSALRTKLWRAIAPARRENGHAT